MVFNPDRRAYTSRPVLETAGHCKLHHADAGIPFLLPRTRIRTRVDTYLTLKSCSAYLPVRLPTRLPACLPACTYVADCLSKTWGCPLYFLGTLPDQCSLVQVVQNPGLSAGERCGRSAAIRRTVVQYPGSLRITWRGDRACFSVWWSGLTEDSVRPVPGNR